MSAPRGPGRAGKSWRDAGAEWGSAGVVTEKNGPAENRTD